MAQQWFGAPWPSAELRSPVCEDERFHVQTPVGERCGWCEDEIAPEDRGVLMGSVIVGDDGEPKAIVLPWHIECELRMGLGGPAHILGECQCVGGTCDPDRGMSAREAALWVWRYWTMKRRAS